jgi:hypothetical protein
LVNVGFAYEQFRRLGLRTADPAGRATIGFYVLEGDVLTMTDGEGKPVLAMEWNHRNLLGSSPVTLDSSP